MAGPTLTARIFSKPGACTRSWTLPVWFHALSSVGNYPVILSTRIADELHIKDGDVICFEIWELRQEYSFPVLVTEDGNNDFDFIIDGAVGGDLNMIKSFLYDATEGHSFISSDTGLKTGNIPDQQMFSTFKVKEKRGKCRLHFSGQSRGYGYYITFESTGEWLVKGYGYKSDKYSCKYMECLGLLEGMTWAERLDTKSIVVHHGESNTTLSRGKVALGKNGTFKEFSDAFQSIVDSLGRNGTKVSLRKTCTKEFAEVKGLTAMGVSRMENKVVVNWQAANKIMSR